MNFIGCSVIVTAIFSELVYMVVHTLYARSSQVGGLKVAIVDGLSELPTTRLIQFIFIKEKYVWEKDRVFYLYSFQSNNAFFVLLLLISDLGWKWWLEERKEKRRVDLFHRSVWPLWHNTLEKKHTWIVYLEDRASWFSKCRHCKAVWNKMPNHFTAQQPLCYIDISVEQVSSHIPSSFTSCLPKSRHRLPWC